MTNFASALCLGTILLCVAYFVIVGILYTTVLGGAAAIIGIILGAAAACAGMFVYGSEHTTGNAG